MIDRFVFEVRGLAGSVLHGFLSADTPEWYWGTKIQSTRWLRISSIKEYWKILCFLPPLKGQCLENHMGHEQLAINWITNLFVYFSNCCLNLCCSLQRRIFEKFILFRETEENQFSLEIWAPCREDTWKKRVAFKNRTLLFFQPIVHILWTESYVREPLAS